MKYPTLPDSELDRLFKEVAESKRPIDGVILAADHDDIQILHVSVGTKPISTNELCLKKKRVQGNGREWELVQPLYFL